jgi:hypothetical protein
MGMENNYHNKKGVKYNRTKIELKLNKQRPVYYSISINLDSTGYTVLKFLKIFRSHMSQWGCPNEFQIWSQFWNGSIRASEVLQFSLHFLSEIGPKNFLIHKSFRAYLNWQFWTHMSQVIPLSKLIEIL